MTFTFWDILVNLLQEDDEDVKNTAAKVIHKLNPQVQVDVHPFLALDLTMGYMVLLHHKKHRLAVWKTLLKWIDISQEDDTGEDGRLFDKNEMNTWREDVQFVKIVTKYIIYMVLSFDNSSDINFIIRLNDGNTEYQTQTATECKTPDKSFSGSASPEFTVIRDKLLKLHSDLLEQLPSNKAVILDPCPGDMYTLFCDVLCQHLAILQQQNSFDLHLNPFKDANKYIQWSVNKFKLEMIIHLYECMCNNNL